MRNYIFNFSAKKVEELGIKGNPIIILDYLDRFFKSGAAKVKEQHNKNYFWITYNKIVKDNLFLGIEHQRVKQIIDELCSKSVLSKYDNGGQHYTNLYLNIDYKKLTDQADGDLTQIVGNDTTLQFYTPSNINYFNNIKYNAFKFIYETPAIQTIIIETDKIRFNKILLGYFQRLLNPQNYSMLFKNLNFTTNQNSITLNYKLTEAIVESNVYKIEQCIVGAYTTLLVTQLLNKLPAKSSPNSENKPNGKFDFIDDIKI